jgi:hypothetical protein
MPVTTRSQAKKQQELNANDDPTINDEPTINDDPTINDEPTINDDPTINDEPVAKPKKVKNTFNYLYKDENTGIEFISESQLKKRYKSDIRPNLQDIQRKLPIDIHAYQKITEILPSYLENVPEHIQKQKDIYVIPPRGRAWKERNSYTSTSYFHLDDYWVLVKIPIRKRRC